jgi:hypothetical protein
MLITITNLTNNRISIESLTATIAPRSTRTVKNLGVTKMDVLIEKELKKFETAGHITYSVGEDPDVDDEFEAAFIGMLTNFYKVDMIDAPDVGGGGTTVTVGFKLVNVGFGPVDAQKLVELGAYDDAYASVPAATAVLGTATKGTIVLGDGTAALKVLTDANGEFECTLTDTADETVYIAAAVTAGGPALDCTEIDSVVFSA